MSYTEQQLKDAVDAVFVKYDSDHNDSLDAKEVFSLINDALSHIKSGKTVSEAEVKQFIAAADNSGDGKIQKPELYQIFKKALSG
jgi:Ca2+-binding EF-hand superfamily protein